MTFCNRRAGLRPALQGLKRCQLILRVASRVDLRVRLGDLAVLVDHVGDAAGVLVIRFLGGAVRDRQFAVGIAQQREGEVELLRKAGVVLGRVETDAEDPGVARLVLVREVPEPGTLGRSAGCVGLRVEPEDDFLPAEVRQLHAIAVVVDDVEFGGGISNLQHTRTSKDVAQFSAKRHAGIVPA